MHSKGGLWNEHNIGNHLNILKLCLLFSFTGIAIKATRDLLKLADKPAFVVFNAVPPRGTLYQEACEAVATHGLETTPMYFVQRNAFMNSLKDGLTAQEDDPRGKAAQEVKALFDWVRKRVNL